MLFCLATGLKNVWGAKPLFTPGIMPICRRNRVLTPDTDDAEN
jgi:hypothetical protein